MLCSLLCKSSFGKSLPSMHIVLLHSHRCTVCVSFHLSLTFLHVTHSPLSLSHYCSFCNRRLLRMAFRLPLCSIYYLLLLVPGKKKKTHAQAAWLFPRFSRMSHSSVKHGLISWAGLSLTEITEPESLCWGTSLTLTRCSVPRESD